MEKKKIVVLGGGTGASMMLRGLRTHPVSLSAIVSMADDGGSTGMLRRELDVLPPGDVRACLLSLSHADPALKGLFQYRFTQGSLQGQNVGNILLAALEKSTGSFAEAVTVVSRMLQVEGQVIPVTLTKTTLGVVHGPEQKRVMGEHLIDENLPLGEPRQFFLEPEAVISDQARGAILQADILIFGPGSLATSLIPILIVNGVKDAIEASKAKIVFNTNLTTTPGQTDGYTVLDYVRVIESYLPRPVDLVTYHHGDISPDLSVHLEEGSAFVTLGSPTAEEREKIVGADLLSSDVAKPVPGDLVVRKALSHDSETLARLILERI